MSARRIREWVVSSDFFEHKTVDGPDVYMPDRMYPHIHIGKDFVTYSESSTSHQYLVSGDVVSTEQARALFLALNDWKELRNERIADIVQVCRYVAGRFREEKGGLGAPP